MSAEPHSFEVTDDNFAETVLEPSHTVPVLVDFWAEWCQPCKQLAPVLDKLVQAYGGRFLLGKLDIDAQRDLAAEAGVRSVPTVMVFRKGLVADQFVGIQPESVIRGVIERNLFRESDRLLEQARQARAEGERDRAVELAEQALALDPDQGELQFEVARLLIDAGQLDRGARLLGELPRQIRESAPAEALEARVALARELLDAPDPALLEQALAQDPTDSAARYQLAAHLVQREEYGGALGHLLEIVRRDRDFRDDAGRKAMLAVFAVLGDEHPLVQRYRTAMFNALH